MARTTSQPTAGALDDPPDRMAGNSGPHKLDGVQPAGVIISIRPSRALETTEELRESNARLKALLSSLDDLVFELDTNGTYMAVWATNEALLLAPRASSSAGQCAMCWATGPVVA
jgi:hypothetical protein